MNSIITLKLLSIVLQERISFTLQFSIIPFILNTSLAKVFPFLYFITSLPKRDLYFSKIFTFALLLQGTSKIPAADMNNHSSFDIFKKLNIVCPTFKFFLLPYQAQYEHSDISLSFLYCSRVSYLSI